MIRPHYTLVNPYHVDEAWPVVSPWLIQAIGEEVHWGHIEQIRTEVRAGSMHLWVVQEEGTGDVLAVAVTEPQVLGNHKVLVVRWMGGRDIDQWLHDMAVIERWAKINNFVRVEIWGRPGWSKKFAPYGYREDYRVIGKQIEKELH
jgi:hypothetical protein